MAFLAVAFCIGVVAGLRTFTAPMLVSCAARLGLLHLDGTWSAFLGYRWTPWIFSLLAVGEFVTDKLPTTPSRKTPPQFVGRIITGSFSGAAIGAASGSVIGGLLAGAVGAVAGTLGGAELRSRLVKATGGRDFPIALLEDAIAVVGGAILLKMSL
jgi:uncharacterized membrane protein